MKNGVFTAAFGPAGQPYAITTDQKQVVITPVPGAAPDPDALRNILVRFLKAVDTEARSHETLEDLLRKCRPYLDG